jgi:hypothetical protein
LNADPEVRARHAAAMADPEVRARHAAAMADPEVRARHAAAMKAAMADPEVRARHAAAMKARSPLSKLSAEQRRVYDTLRRKGCTRDEALREACKPRRRPMAEAAE